ncbi:MAG: flagellar hook-basal body complex protein FliE [Firmicutes bacterium]|nr:flagellar hook-basal body complex protein FliE [Bacillota bacterium]
MQTDNSIASLYNITFRPAYAAGTEAAGPANAFGDFLDAALGAINRTNARLSEAGQAQLDLASGRTDDILSVLMAQEKAYTSLNLTVQVTNRVIDAYREIMRMQL